MADSRQFKEQLNLIKKLNDATRERAKSEKQLDDSFLDREKILSNIIKNKEDVNKLSDIQKDIEKKITDYIWIFALTIFYLVSSIFLFLWVGVKNVFNKDK